MKTMRSMKSLLLGSSTDDLGFTAPPVPVKPSPPEQITTLEKGSIRITSANNTNRHRRNSIVGQGTESLPSNVASLPEKFGTKVNNNHNYMLSNGISALNSSPIHSVRGSLDSVDSFDKKIEKDAENKPNNLERFKRSFSNMKLSSPKNKEFNRNEHISEARFIDGENSYTSEQMHSNKSINITVRKNSRNSESFENNMDKKKENDEHIGMFSEGFTAPPVPVKPRSSVDVDELRSSKSMDDELKDGEGGGKLSFFEDRENNGERSSELFIELPKIHSLKTHQVENLSTGVGVENLQSSDQNHIFPIIDTVNSENESMLCPACSILFSAKSSPSPINMLSDKLSSKNGVTLSERRTSLVYPSKIKTPPSSFIIDKKTKISAKVPSPEERKILLLVSIQEGLNELQDHSIIMFEELKRINFNVNLLTSKMIQLNNIIGNLQ